MLRELLSRNPNIIINTDIDGILSGIILCHYCGCRIVGFSNSKDMVWLCDGVDDVFSPVYIDMFVPNARACCVDQHIVSVNDKHHNIFVAQGNKLSPQLDRHRIFQKNDYTYKYPFGAVHYIIAMLEKEGVKVDGLPMKSEVDKELGLCVGDLVLRADDAMKTTLDSNYMKNAEDWWGWLIDQSGNAASVKGLSDYLYDFRKGYDISEIKNNTKRYLNTNFLSKTSDGGFYIITDSSGNLLPNIVKYIDEMARLINIPISYPKHYIVHKGEYNLKYWSPQWEDEFINYNTIDGEEVFSYAFIYGPSGRFQNFSYTTKMK